MTRIAIIGAGFSGLCLGIQLQKAGFHALVILEKAERLGGTWRDNTYPGAACDSPSFAYCLSFAQKTDWSRKWAPQEEILAYLEDCARDHDLVRRIRFGAEVEAARFDAEAGVWRVRLAGGEELEAEILVSSVGQLHRPHVPDLPGLGDFEGPWFHSARWRHDVPLAGRDVAVIGNAASAVQFVPQIATAVRTLTLFQRSANWMIPKRDRRYSEREKALFGRLPWLARLYRAWIWLSYELRWPLLRRSGFLSRQIEKLAIRSMRGQIPDPKLQEALIPDYPLGGKRILISDDYYPALVRENVRVVTEPIARIGRDALVTRDGASHRADVLILATGFETTSFLAPMKIEGRDGRALHDVWKHGAEAYLGLSVAGFPNFFMTYGPNTNLGHNSILFMIECQARYIVDCLAQMARRELAWIDLHADVMAAFDRRLQAELARTVWARTARSWYKTCDGRITNNWSGSTLRYGWATRRADLSRYEQHPRRRNRSVEAHTAA
jgi:cation diffusion facilitator CzcD-associated flavoprotein CzcO